MEVVVTETPLEVAVTETPLEVVVMEAPLEVAVTETPLEVAVMETQPEVVVTETPLEVVVMEAPPEVVEFVEEPEGEKKLIPIKVKMSHYDPSLGGTNCFNFVNGECLSKTSSGQRWQDWWDKGAVACPQEIPFWTEIIIDGKTYVCLDRGGAIVITPNGEYWMDVLGPPIAPYGTIMDGYIVEE